MCHCTDGMNLNIKNEKQKDENDIILYVDYDMLVVRFL